MGFFDIEQKVKYIPKLKMNYFRVKKPSKLLFQVNDFCNSRCKMCRIWENKEHDVNVSAFDNVFSNAFFNSIDTLFFTGGEIFLCQNLAEIVVSIAGKFNLKIIGLVTNGLLSEKIVSDVRKILERVRCNVQVIVSLDGIGSYEAIRGVDGFNNVKETLKRLKEMDVELFVNTLIMPQNIDELETLYDFGSNYGKVIFSTVNYSGFYGNNAVGKRFEFDDGDRDKVISFLEIISNNDNSTIGFYHRDLIRILKGLKKLKQCQMGRDVIFMNFKGDINVCMNANSLLGNVYDDRIDIIWRKASSALKNIKHCGSCSQSCAFDTVSLTEFVSFYRGLK